MPKTLPPLPSPRHARFVLAALVLAVPPTRAESRSFDVLIRGGTVYDGSGGAPRRADVALLGDRIEAVGDLASSARTVLDATGLAVAPGFVNILSWATEDLVADPRSQSDIRQGVTTEIFGEGESYGPWSGGGPCRATSVTRSHGRRSASTCSKAAGEAAWPKLARVIDKVEPARSRTRSSP